MIIHEILEKKIQNQNIICCHYMMKIWPKSHYNSWQLFGHSHGGMNGRTEGKQMDVGVDTNNFYPYSFEEIKTIMNLKPNNLNLLRRSL